MVLRDPGKSASINGGQGKTKKAATPVWQLAELIKGNLPTRCSGWLLQVRCIAPVPDGVGQWPVPGDLRAVGHGGGAGLCQPLSIFP